MAVDLREIVGALRIANDLERIGDLAKNIAKRVVALEGDFHPSKLLRGVEHMAVARARPAQGRARRLRRAATAERAGGLAAATRRSTRMYTSLFRELLTYMMEDPRNITFCTHLLFCAKNIERIGDHATNIAETVHYMVEGRPIADDAAEGRHHGLRQGGGDRNGDTAMSARILIVEDEEPLALLLRYNLEAEGYEVETVARGDEAETRLRESVARPGGARLDAARPVRHRAVPAAAGAARDQARCRSSC